MPNKAPAVFKIYQDENNKINDMGINKQSNKLSRNSGSHFISQKNERKMNDNKVAKLIASKVYNPSIGDEDFAVQLFIESLVLPNGCEAYTEERIYEHLKNFMRSHKKPLKVSI